MKSSRIGRRYARAILRQFKSDEDAKKAGEALFGLSSLFELEQAAKILRSPVMPKDLKFSLMNYVLDKVGAEKSLKDFVKTLVAEGRVGFLPDIHVAFEEILDERRNVVKADVHSSVKLTDAQAQDIKATLEKMLSKKVELENQVDPKIMGGLWVQVGNSVIDLSLKSRLEALASAAAL